MNLEQIDYHFISRNSPYYRTAVALRYEVFFKPSGALLDKLLDSKEDKSMHLVATHKDEVVGYIRITLDGKKAQLSQFVVAPSQQGKIELTRNLYDKAMAKAKEMGAKKVSGEIRLPMAKLASRFGYKVSDDVYESPETGIEHRHAEKDL
ncbi:MAG: GNAT family N-acetyltransferase [Chloroflexi bacterium]|nr:GNAT family N-acetyltransferase [Chloroflexota bacterium]MBT7082149.1 GNAT family N-acetyltransferase [Chloroflexota bacterium]MBT7290790.1 GNAT family N-acetyltransferase [Chloroflexota bacterium]